MSTEPTPENTGKVVDFDQKRVEQEQHQQNDGAKKQKTPIEQYWVKYLLRTGDYAVSYDENGTPILWQWNKKKRIWESSTKASLTKDVIRFIRREKPSMYSDKNIKVCVSNTEGFISAEGREIEKNDDFIISTNSHFLEVQKDGQIKAYDKDDLGGQCKKYFPRCHVEIDLNKTAKDRVGINYLLPNSNSIEQKDSLLARMIKLGFPKLDNRRCAQEFMGDTLNPQKRKAFPVLVGEPDGGKSQFLSLLAGLHNKSSQIDLERLDTFDSHKLLGRSFVYVDEIGKTMKEKHFKRLIGGANFDIQRKGLENLSVRTDCKFMAADNEVFGFSEKSGAIETRIFLIKVESVKQEDRIDDIANLIVNDENERQDLLDWLLIGAVAVLKRGRLMRHDEMPQDSRDKMDNLANKMNPCVSFLRDNGAKFNENNLIPKIDVFKNFVRYCEETNRGFFKNVAFETWCRDYFTSAIKKVCVDYDEKLERRAYTMIDGERKRVACFPLEFTNMPEYFGKKVSTMQAIETYHDKEAYEKDKLPEHILKTIQAEAEELQRTINLTNEQKKSYTENKLKADGWKKDKKTGGWFKGDSSIQF